MDISNFELVLSIGMLKRMIVLLFSCHVISFLLDLFGYYYRGRVYGFFSRCLMFDYWLLVVVSSLITLGYIIHGDLFGMFNIVS